MKRVCRFARLFLVCLLAQGSLAGAWAEESAPAEGTTRAVWALADLQEMALLHNPTLVQSAAHIEAARGRALQAGLYPNPTVGYASDQIGIEGTAGELQGAFIQQTIVTAGKLRLSRAKYNQQAVVAELLALGQRLRVLNGVSIHYYELLAIARMLENRRRHLANAEEALRTTREMFNTGQANQAEVLLAEIEANRARVALVSEEARYQAGWQTLTALLGTPDIQPAPLEGSLEQACPPPDWHASLDQLLTDSPDLQAARAHVVKDQITLRRERAQPYPDINIQANAGYNYETLNTVGGVQIGLRIPLWDRNQGTIRQAQADLSRSQAEVVRLELALRSQLAMQFQVYRTALETARLYREENVPKAREAHALILDMYRKRRAPWKDVVSLQQNLIAVEADYTHSLLDLRKAEVAINGLLMVDGLGQPAAPPLGGHINATPRPR